MFFSRFRRALWLLGALTVVLLAFASCEDGECKHLRLKSTLYEPTCAEQGYVLHVCRDCKYAYKSDFTEPLGHTFAKTVTAPTCTAEGFTAYSCDCGYSYTTDYQVPTGHDLTATVTAPTCDEQGYTVYACTRDCGYSYTADLTAPTGHDLSAIHYAATCTTGAYTRSVCSACGLDYRSAPTEPLGHTFTDTVVYPSIARTGYTAHTCHCGYSYTDNYVWYSDIFTGAYAGDGTLLATGIDISYWNTDIDWDLLAATGIDYVIIRGGSIYQMPDRMFETHYANARAAGLDVGCYFYTYATTVEEVLEEAEAFLKVLEGKQFEYPIYFDIEDGSLANLDQEVLMDMCLAFCQTMSDNGYFPAVYINHKWLTKILHTEEILTLYDLWYARYPLDSADGDSRFTYGKWNSPVNYTQYGMWQYTECGQIDGVEGEVDLNFCYKDYPTLIKQYGYNGFTAE